MAGICWARQELSWGTFGSSDRADGKNNVPMNAGCRARFLEALLCLIGVFSVAECSSVNSLRRVDWTEL